MNKNRLKDCFGGFKANIRCWWTSTKAMLYVKDGKLIFTGYGSTSFIDYLYVFTPIYFWHKRWFAGIHLPTYIKWLSIRKKVYKFAADNEHSSIHFQGFSEGGCMAILAMESFIRDKGANYMYITHDILSPYKVWLKYRKPVHITVYDPASNWPQWLKGFINPIPHLSEHKKYEWAKLHFNLRDVVERDEL